MMRKPCRICGSLYYAPCPGSPVTDPGLCPAHRDGLQQHQEVNAPRHHRPRKASAETYDIPPAPKKRRPRQTKHDDGRHHAPPKPTTPTTGD